VLTKFRTDLAGPCEKQRVDRRLASFVADYQFEAIGEQGSHHEAHFVFGRVAGGARLDIETLGKRQVWQAGS